MSDLDIEHLDLDELERLLQDALNPAVPVEVFYAALDRLVASAQWQAPPGQEPRPNHPDGRS